MSRSRSLFAAVLAASLSAIAATPSLARTHEYTLANGLKLIVQEDHRAPVAVVQIWYKVGASYEQDGATGVSHALEHMMFKRTQHLATGEFSRLIAERGGRENAFTSLDYTAYFQQWSKDDVAESFRLEAERMQHLVLDAQEFATEKKVVAEERRLRTDDDPQALAAEVASAVAWQTSPYRQPVIGWAADIDSMQLADLRAWYERWYTPSNATLVVVGDVEPEAVKALAQTHFGAIPARDVEAPRPRPEVAQHGEKRVTIRNEKVRLPHLMLMYKAPTLTQVGESGLDGKPVEAWEIYALDVLAAVLDGGDSARFARELVRGRELAAQIGVDYQSVSRLPDLFGIEATPREGVALDALEAAIVEQLEAIKQAPPNAEELARVKTRVVADTVYQQDSMFYQAMLIGSLESAGLSWRVKDEYDARIRAVTAEQVQAVARRYLTSEHVTVARLVPAAESP
ncbi:MAG TPA: pitrilysin family protein [Gammaproteobacteria bacterium]|nr:pitrilysin family protein [Gammaproteobacteria bacterium]